MGQGGEGITYRATVNGEDIVLKFVQFQQNNLGRNAQLLERLHGNVNEILERDYSIFEFGECLVIRGKYIEGSNLVQDVEERGLHTQLQVLDYLISTLEKELIPLHVRGFTHGDIKPANVIVDDARIYTTIDFGALRNLDELSAVTLTGTLDPRTLAYSRLDLRHDVSDDLYSLAQTAYFLLTGQDPIFVTDEKEQQRLNEMAFSELNINKKLKKECLTMMGYGRKILSSSDIVFNLKDIRKEVAKEMGVGVIKTPDIPQDLQERIDYLTKTFDVEYNPFLANRKPASKEFIVELDRVLIELGYKKLSDEGQTKDVYVRLRNEAELSDYVELCHNEQKYLKHWKFKGDMSKARKLMEIEEGKGLYGPVTVGLNIAIFATLGASFFYGLEPPIENSETNAAVASGLIWGGIIGGGISAANRVIFKIDEKTPKLRQMLAIPSVHLITKLAYDIIQSLRFGNVSYNKDALEKILEPAPGFIYEVLEEE